MTAQHWLFAGGIYTAGFVLFHLSFWKLFDWKEQLPRLSWVNRAIMQVLNLSLTAVFVLIAWLSIFHADEMAGSSLGRTLTAGIAVIWFLRAIEQIVFFKLRHAGSIAFLAVFLLGTALYTLPLLSGAA